MGPEKSRDPSGCSKKRAWGFGVRWSQAAAGMLRPHASPHSFLGATKHQQFMGCETSHAKGLHP